jgi:hypothetical protein
MFFPHPVIPIQNLKMNEFSLFWVAVNLNCHFPSLFPSFSAIMALFSSISFLFVYWMAVVTGFYQQTVWRTRLSTAVRAMTSVSLPPAPTTEKARLVIQLSGPSVTSALFRAELKKELVFFRGCRGHFAPTVCKAEDSTCEATVTCEGKTKQIERFINWLAALSVDVALRPPNFQGPRMTAYMTSIEWSDYVGDLKVTKLTTTSPPPIPTPIVLKLSVASMSTALSWSQTYYALADSLSLPAGIRNRRRSTIP